MIFATLFLQRVPAVLFLSLSLSMPVLFCVAIKGFLLCLALRLLGSLRFHPEYSGYIPDSRSIAEGV